MPGWRWKRVSPFESRRRTRLALLGRRAPSAARARQATGTQDRDAVFVEIAYDVSVTRAEIRNDMSLDVDTQAIARFDGCGFLDHQGGEAAVDCMAHEQVSERT